MRGRDDGWMNWATEVFRAEVRVRGRGAEATLLRTMEDS